MGLSHLCSPLPSPLTRPSSTQGHHFIQTTSLLFLFYADTFSTTASRPACTASQKLSGSCFPQDAQVPSSLHLRADRDQSSASSLFLSFSFPPCPPTQNQAGTQLLPTLHSKPEFMSHEHQEQAEKISLPQSQQSCKHLEKYSWTLLRPAPSTCPSCWLCPALSASFSWPTSTGHGTRPPGPL